MSDNTQLSAAVGVGDVLKTDDLGAYKIACSKITLGADGVDGGEVSSANPLPISDAGGSVTVDAPVGAPAFVRLSDGSAAVAPLTESNFDTKVGSLTETAPATDTASSGLNGRLQRLAQRITSLIALLPAALGAGGGLKVDGSGTALPVSGSTSPIAVSSGGATPYYYLAAAGVNQDSTVVKASAGQVYSVNGFSVRTTPIYLKLYNKATGPTSADTPVHVFMIPSQGTANGAGFTFAVPVALEFSAGISFRLCTGIAVADATAVTAADCVVNLGYK